MKNLTECINERQFGFENYQYFRTINQKDFKKLDYLRIEMLKGNVLCIGEESLKEYLKQDGREDLIDKIEALKDPTDTLKYETQHCEEILLIRIK